MKRIFCAITILALASAPAAARYKLQEVCRFDIEQYCKGFRPKQKKAIKACLENHHKQLLPRCQDFYKEAN